MSEYDIDLVVPWVDGSDPEWQAEKKVYEQPYPVGDTDACRFRDWGLIEYLFRSIAMFLPWIRKIHFITCGHLPPFLNTAHPKLHIVNHRDFMPAETLPCFNSSALEMYIHRIPGLAERFIYINDDIFFLQPAPPERFFAGKDGLPCCLYAEHPVRPYMKIEQWSAYLLHDAGVINSMFSKNGAKRPGRIVSRKLPLSYNLRNVALRLLFPKFYCGFLIPHTYSCFLKSVIEEVWEAVPDLLDRVGRTKFRTWEDVNQWLFYMWQLAEGRYVIANPDYRVYTAMEDNVQEICDAIRTHRYESVCINDGRESDADRLAPIIAGAFRDILPEKCAYEI